MFFVILAHVENSIFEFKNMFPFAIFHGCIIINTKTHGYVYNSKLFAFLKRWYKYKTAMLKRYPGFEFGWYVIKLSENYRIWLRDQLSLYHGELLNLLFIV